MIQVSCIGASSQSASEEELRTFCAVAHDYGRTNHITGSFIYRDDAFLLILEGEATNVDEMFWRLGTSHRCSRLRLLARTYLVTRNFPSWIVSFSYPSSVTTRMPSYRAVTELSELRGDARLVEQRIRAFREGHLRVD